MVNWKPAWEFKTNSDYLERPHFWINKWVSKELNQLKKQAWSFSLWWLMVAGAADLCFSLSTFTSASALSTLSPQSRDGRSNLVIVPLLWSGRYKDRDIGSIPQLLFWGPVLPILKNKYVATIYGSWTESTELSSPIARKEEGLGKKVGCQLSGKDWVVCCRGNLFWFCQWNGKWRC